MADATTTDPKLRDALEKLTSAMQFVLAFYEPQTHLDTEAWKLAEAGARQAHKNAKAALLSASQPSAPVDTDAARIRAQFDSNRQHERHSTASETAYWCQQYCLLAKQAIGALTRAESNVTALHAERDRLIERVKDLEGRITNATA